MQPTPRRWGHRAHYIVGVTPVVPFQRYAVRAGTLIRRVCTVTTHAAEEDVTGFMQHPGQGRIIPHRHLFFHSEVTVHFYAEEHHLQTAWADLDEMPQLEHKPWHIDRTPAGATCRLTSSPVSPPRHEVPQDQEWTDTEDERDSEGTVDEAGTDPDSDISHAQGATPTTPPTEGAVIDMVGHRPLYVPTFIIEQQEDLAFAVMEALSIPADMLVAAYLLPPAPTEGRDIGHNRVLVELRGQRPPALQMACLVHIVCTTLTEGQGATYEHAAFVPMHFRRNWAQYLHRPHPGREHRYYGVSRQPRIGGEHGPAPQRRPDPHH